jgi:polar amino acid transport system permease protein
VTLYVEAVRGIPTLVLVYYMALAAIPQLIMLGNDLGEWLSWLTITIHISDDTAWRLTFRGIGRALATFQTRDFPNTYRAIIGLAISYSAFLSEVFRAGIESVGAGQREAAASLGMTRWQVMRLIVLPQAIRTVIPPLANDFIAMLKESSLVSILGVEDITRQGQTYAASTFTFFQVYNVVALTYLVLTISLSMAVKLLEAYMYRGRER